MLFPIVILLFERIGVGLGLGAVALMVLSGQWYILFNVISAVANIPEQLKEATTLFRLPWLARWRSLYLPAAFPALQRAHCMDRQPCNGRELLLRESRLEDHAAAPQSAKPIARMTETRSWRIPNPTLFGTIRRWMTGSPTRST